MNATAINKFFRVALSGALMFIATAVSAQQLFVRPSAGTAVRVGETRGFFAVLTKADGTIINPIASGVTFSIVSGPATVNGTTGDVTGTATAANATAVVQASYTDAVHTGGVTLTATQNVTIQASQDFWTATTGSVAHGGDIRTITNTGVGSILTAVYGGGIYRTTTGAGGWVQSAYGLPQTGSARVRAIRGALSDFSIVAAVEGSGVYRSTNGGASWTASNSGLGSFFPRAFGYRTTTGASYLYVATNGGVYKSTNNGQSWFSASSGLPAGQVSGIQALSNSDTVWAVVSGSGIYRSTDGAATWVARNNGIPLSGGVPQVYNVTLPPSTSSSVQLAMVEGGGIYRSSDNGANWVAQNSGLPAVSPATYGFQGGIGTPGDGYIYVSIDNQGIYRGTTGSNLSNNVTWALWTNSASLPKVRVRTPTLINGVYYVATGQGVYTSSDSGATWTPFKSGLPRGYVINTVTDSTDTNLVFAAADGVYKSTNGGASWAPASTGITGAVSGGQRGGAGSITRTQNGDLYVSTVNDGVFKSVDLGASWTAVNSGLPALMGQGIAIRPDPVDGQTLYALFNSDALGVYKTVNGGTTWTSITGNLPAGNAQRTREIAKDTATGDLYLATDGGLYRSTSGGASWGATSYTATSVSHVRIDTGTSPSTVYFATSVRNGTNQAQTSSGVYKSVNQGASHVQLLSSRLIQNLRVVRSSGFLRLYALSWNITSNLNQSRVLKSTDDGTTWQSDFAGMPHAFVNSLDTVNNEVVRASTIGGGVFNFTSTESTSVVTATSAALTTLNNLRNAINSNSATLAYTHLTGFYDAGFLNEGRDATLDSKDFASEFRGGSITSFTIDGVNSYDEANGILAVRGTVTIPGEGTIPLDSREDGFVIFKRQGDGSYKMYGDQRIAQISPNVEMRTDYGPSFSIAPRQIVNFHVNAPAGVLSTGVGVHSATAVPNLWGASLPVTLINNGDKLETITGSPGVPENFTNNNFFGNLDTGATQVPNGTIFQFTLTKFDNSTVVYSKQFIGSPLTNPATQSITNVTINSGTATSFASSVLSSPLNVAWTLPSGFSISVVRLYGYVKNASNQQCTDEIEFGGSAASGQLNLPTTCGGQPVTTGGINVSAIGPEDSGHQASYIYNFNITGAGPAVGFSTGNLGFGSVNVGATSSAQNITVTNTGTGTLSISTAAVSGTGFATTANACTGANLTAGQTCVVSITFSPAGGGAASGSLTITSNASGSPNSTALSGTGVAVGPAAVTLSTPSLAFGNQPVSVPGANQSVTITNSGGTTLNISSIVSASSIEFVVVSNTCAATLAAGNNCVVTLSFVPQSLGVRSGTLTITSDAATGSPHVVTLGGTGTTSNTSARLFVRPAAGTAVRVGETRNFFSVLTKPDGSIMNPTGVSYSITSGPATVDSSGNVTGTATASNATAILSGSYIDATHTGGATLTATQTITIQASQDVWAAAGNLAQGGDVRSVINTGIGAILAPIYGGGIYRTTTGSVGWEQSAYGLPQTGSARVRSIRGALSDFSIVAAVEGSGVYRSTNGGASWTASNNGLGNFFPRAFGYRTTNNSLYVATNGGVYKSTNSGVNWFAASAGLPAGTAVTGIQAFSGSETVWATVSGAGLYRSSDGAASWTPMNTGIPLSIGGVPQVYSFTAPANTGSSVYLAMVEGGGIYRSTNGGGNWAPDNNGLPVAEPASTYGFQGGIATPGDGYVYVSIDGFGIYRGTTGSSHANPMTWAAWGTTATQLPKVRTRTPSLINGVYYVPTGQGVYTSADSGATWTAFKTGLPRGYVVNTVTDPADTNIVYAAADTVYKSTNGGSTWVASGAADIIGAISGGQRGSSGNITRASDGTLYVSTVNRGIYRSTDNAASWTSVNNGLPNPLGQGIAVRNDPSNAQTLYALFDADELGVYRTVDGGANWTSITGDLPAGNARRTQTIVKDTATGDLYLATNGGLYRSVNGGTNWTATSYTGRVGQLRIDTGTSPSTVYFSTYVADGFNTAQSSSGVYKSVDQGASHTQLLSNRLIQNLRVVRSGSLLRMYALSWNITSSLNQSRVLKSMDGGATWESDYAGMPPAFVNSLDIANNLVVRASTIGGGVFNFTSADVLPPPTPTGVIATVTGGNNIQITWNSSSGATGYNIYMATASGVTKLNYASLAGGHVHTNVTSPYTHSAAAVGTHYVVVTAINAAGESSESAEASATVLAAAPAVGLSAGSLSYGNVSVGLTSAAQSITVTNTGTGTLSISTASVTGTGFATTANTCNSANLTAAQTCVVTITLTPGGAGAASGSLTITSNAVSGNPHTVSLSGTGVTGVNYTPVLEQGWNLMGNSLNTTLNIATVFGSAASPVAGVTSRITSIWKWDAASGGVWAFYAPSLSAGALQTFVDNAGYLLLTDIGPGEGYWVNVSGSGPLTMPSQNAATAFSWGSSNYATLPSSWNLIADGAGTPRSAHGFANAVSANPPPTFGVNSDNFLSLWAWDAQNQAWFFYAPSLENASCPGSPGNLCGLGGVKLYADNAGYLHFEDAVPPKKLGIGTGFWVNKSY